MPYEIIRPPFSLSFTEMSRKELRGYFDWVLRHIRQRIDVLATAVTETPGFEDWQPDRTPDSLLALGKWFGTQVETRELTPQEKERHELENQRTFPVDMPEWELTNRTYSIAFDVGIYFSQVLHAAFPSLKWELPLSSKRFAYYGQPCLGKFGRTLLNPVAIAIVIASSFADGEPNDGRLRELFDVWAQDVE